MNKQIHSAAYRQAELRSERLRILGVLGVFALYVCLTALRVFVTQTASKTTPWAWTFLLAAVLILYELWMLRMVDLALKASSTLAPELWILSTVVETSIPAIAVAFLTGSQID